MRTRGLAVIAASLALCGVLTACSEGDDSPSARLTAEGTTEVSGGGDDWRAVTGTVGLKSGQQVRVIDGMATVKFGDDRQLQLRRGTEISLSPVPGGDEVRPSLAKGDLLVEAPGERLNVESGDSNVEVSRGVARISRGLTVIVGSYSGTVTVNSAGRQLVVPPLHQATVAAIGLLPSRPSPLSYSPGDVWDERFLGDAIQLGDELAARSRGFTAQLRPGQDLDASFYRALLPALGAQPEVDAVLPIPDRPAGETLVGLAITAEGSRGSFIDRLRRVFSFHDEGAAWGIVALDQGVNRVRILGAVDSAIGRGPTLAAEEVAPPPTSVSPTSPLFQLAAPDTGASSSSSSSSSASSGESAAPQAPETPPPLPSSGPLRSGIPAVDGTVNSLVDVLSGLLHALGR